MDSVVIFGASGQARVIADIIEQQGEMRIAGFIDAHTPAGAKIGRYEVLGAEPEFEHLWKIGAIAGAVIGIGDNWTRHVVAVRIRARLPDIKFLSAVHPSSVIAGRVTIGQGSVIMAGAIVNCDTVIGDHCIINTNASLDHDCTMGDFSSLAPGVTTGGRVTIGVCSALSLGANVINGISIGDHTVLGAGALATKDIPAFNVAYGVPARVVRTRQAGDRYM